MKSIIKIVFSGILLALPILSSATGLVGGQITYKIIDTSLGKYKFQLEIYHICEHIFLSNEQLLVITANSSNLVNLTYLGKDEITPIAYPPDVISPIQTSCQTWNYDVSGNIRYRYEVEIVIGRNIGWVVVGWGSCCGGNEITNITNPGSQGTWIQTAFNTNYVNSSPIHAQPPLAKIPFNRDGIYLLSSYNVHDHAYLNIGGKPVLKDSIAYELVSPSIGAASNFSNLVSNLNPSVIFVAPLNAKSFMHSSKPISVDQNTGILSFRANSVQEVLFAYIVREYRAIPNVNYTSYHRELISHTIRQTKIFVSGLEAPVEFKGIIRDSSRVDSLVNNYTAMTCAIDNKIMFKVVGSPYQNLKVENKGYIDTTYITKYKVNYTKRTGGNVDTLYITLNYLKKKYNPSLDFLLNVYYVNAGGIKIDNFMPIRVLPGNNISQLAQDTMTMCASAPSVRLNAGVVWGVKWTPLTDVVAISSDSTWIDVYPTANRWYKASNLSSSSSCKIHDSIYVKVIACDTIFGRMCTDKDKNCNCDPWEFGIPFTKIVVKGVGNPYYNEVTTDSLGKYWFLVSSWSHYTMESDDKIVSCGINNRTQKTFYQMGGNSTFDLPIVDSIVISNLSYGYIDTNICYGDSFPLDIIFHKNYGYMNTIISYGDGRVDTIKSGINDGFVIINKKHKYAQSGNYTPKIIFCDNQYKPFDSFIFHRLTVLNCIIGKVFIDNNSNCKYDVPNSDKILPYHYFELKNVSTSSITKFFSDVYGTFKIYFNKSNAYELKNRYEINCTSNKYYLTIPSTSKDTSYKIDVPLTNQIVNYILLVDKKGKVEKDSIFDLDLSYSGYFFTDTALKVYTITLPPRLTYSSVSPNASIVSTGNTHKITISNGKSARFSFKFDSVATNDNFCISVKLHKVLPEQDTLDNQLSFCLKANQIYGNMGKNVSIQSQINDVDFTNKNDDIVYQISYRNNRGSTSNHIVMSDVLDAKLDLNTVSILKSSHSMNTYWNGTNQLIFAFRNILLPDSSVSDSASRAYVIFKAKPLASLGIGDEIRNKAGIQIDFDPEFMTNVTKSKLVTPPPPPLSIINSKYKIEIYPNPCTDYIGLNLDKKQKYSIKLLSIDGKLIQVNTESPKHIDMKYLPKGIYLLEIEQENNRYIEKIVKE